METHNSQQQQLQQQVYYIQWQTRTWISSSGGGGDTIAIGETCHRYSLNVNILGKASVLHFALTPFCGLGCAKLSLQIIGNSCARSLQLKG
jgi:hypothetical protein